MFKISTLLQLLCLTCLALCLHGQQQAADPGPARELGLRFSGFDDFNLFYKKALSESKYIRHRVLLGRISYASNAADFDLNLGYAVGIEQRKAIAKNLSFVHGPEFNLSFAYSNSQSRNQFLISPYLGYILGFQLDFTSQFCLTVELIPSVGGNVAIYDYQDNQYKIEALLNSNATALSLMYRF